MTDSTSLLNDPTVAWRAVILYGQNTATYKIALGTVLRNFVARDRVSVTRDELAEAFLDVYTNRLTAGKPQLGHVGRLTVMERIVADLNRGQRRESAIERVGLEAFGDVLPRFHTVYDRPIPKPFYQVHRDGSLVLTDSAFHALGSDDVVGLGEELGARWDMLEAAFEMKRAPGSLANDIRSMYLDRGRERTRITNLEPILHGYQEGRCFYCGELVSPGSGHVDHVIPFQFIRHDEVWNLVLAHGFCNLQKSDRLPSLTIIEQLAGRNEHMIASNHPLRNHLIHNLGVTSAARRREILRVYADAKLVIPWTWDGVPGFTPATSDFYRALVRELEK